MARKVGKKTLTTGDRLFQEKQRCYDELEQETRFVSSPTYRFNVGDKVIFGSMNSAVVEEILSDGKAYILLCNATNNNYGNPYTYNTYRLARWIDIRSFSVIENTNFTEKNDIRLNFSNRTIESLLHIAYFFGVMMNPDYQRDFVWDKADKEYLLDSIFKGVDIGKFVLVHRSDEDWRTDGYSYEILDGKQRLNTLKEFYEDRITYYGKTFSQLSATDKYTFKNHNISVAEIKNVSKKDILTAFLKLNRGGRVMDKTQIEKVEKMLSDYERS